MKQNPTYFKTSGSMHDYGLNIFILYYKIRVLENKIHQLFLSQYTPCSDVIQQIAFS